MSDDFRIDRRRHLRVPLDSMIRISTIDPETDRGTGRPFFRSSTESCINVSRGGVFVQTHERISPGRRVLLEMDLPGGPNIEAIGRVAWSERPDPTREDIGFGIEFLGGSPRHLAQLEAFLGGRQAA